MKWSLLLEEGENNSFFFLSYTPDQARFFLALLGNKCEPTVSSLNETSWLVDTKCQYLTSE